MRLFNSLAGLATNILIVAVFAAFFVMFLAVLGMVALVIMAIFRIPRWIAAYKSRPVKMGLFGAPETHWWLSLSEQLLWKLEDMSKVNFTSTPERLLLGQVIVALIAGAIMVPASVLMGFEALPMFLGVTGICLITAYVMAQPARGWWSSIPANPYAKAKNDDLERLM